MQRFSPPLRWAARKPDEQRTTSQFESPGLPSSLPRLGRSKQDHRVGMPGRPALMGPPTEIGVQPVMDLPRCHRRAQDATSLGNGVCANPQEKIRAWVLNVLHRPPPPPHHGSGPGSSRPNRRTSVKEPTAGGKTGHLRVGNMCSYMSIIAGPYPDARSGERATLTTTPAVEGTARGAANPERPGQASRHPRDGA